MSDLHWLTWAKQIQAIAQSGLAFTHDPFDATTLAFSPDNICRLWP